MAARRPKLIICFKDMIRSQKEHIAFVEDDNEYYSDGTRVAALEQLCGELVDLEKQLDELEADQID